MPDLTTISIPKNTHHRLRIAAAELNEQIGDLATRLLNASLARYFRPAKKGAKK